jgi:hypothetical protein
MMKAPMTAPVTWPTPPRPRPTDEDGRNDVQFKSGGPRRGHVETRGVDEAGQCGQRAHDDEDIEGEPLGVDA